MDNTPFSLSAVTMVLFIGFLTVVFNRIADMAIENGMLQVPDEVDVGGVAVGLVARLDVFGPRGCALGDPPRAISWLVQVRIGVHGPL